MTAKNNYRLIREARARLRPGRSLEGVWLGAALLVSVLLALVPFALLLIARWGQ